MTKKIALGLVALVAMTAGVVGLSAFEAHVINVTAQIENALKVVTTPIDFGTVFPQEELDKELNVTLSDSFVSENRVDDVEYMIRQKPKCGWTTNDGEEGPFGKTQTGEVVVVGTGDEQTTRIDCGDDPEKGTDVPEDATWGQLPLLCPYLSKHEITTDGTETNNDKDVSAFHQPWTVVAGNIVWTEALGRLSKIAGDTFDTWNIDLKVPCFGDHCAQDWAQFVADNDGENNVDADDYVQDIKNEHKVFGCDLWIEVTEVSETPQGEPDPATLKVIKVVVNNSPGLPDLAVADFTLKVDATVVVSGVANVFATGAHVVSEVAVAGYTSVISGDCESDGDVTLLPGDSKTCTITNDDIEVVIPPGTLTVTKIVVNDSLGSPDLAATDFSFAVNAGASTPFEADGTNDMSVAAGTYDVLEDAEVGYTTTYGNSLNANLNCDDLVVPSAGSVTCTITNNDVATAGTLTVTKVVTNDNGGTATVGSFSLFVDASSVSSGVGTVVSAGSHTVSEAGVFGYTATFSGDCDASGLVSVPAGGSASCTITNNDLAPVITLVKTVVGGTAAPDDFDVSIDGAIKSSGSSNAVSANAAHVIDEEVLVSGYTFTSMTGTSFLGVACPAELLGTITLTPGDVVTCTITNTKP